MATGNRTFLWVSVAALLLAFIVPVASGLIWSGNVDGQFKEVKSLIDVNAQDIEDNGNAISTTPITFVPRGELDAKLNNIQLQVGHVQANVEALKEQSERQTAEIIRKIDRINSPADSR